MVNYQEGKIYMVWFEGNDKNYYGSTTTTLSNRLSQHKLHYKNKISKCSLFKLFEEYGVDNARIELVEAFPCNSRSELEAREGHHIRNNTHINRQVPGRSKKEGNKIYREKNIEAIKNRDKEYYQKNKEKIKARSAEYYKKNREEQMKKCRERYAKKQNRVD
jgi:hypothetical protein